MAGKKYVYWAVKPAEPRESHLGFFFEIWGKAGTTAGSAGKIAWQDCPRHVLN